MATSDDERQALADGLAGLDFTELLDVLRRVLPTYVDEDDGRNGVHTRLVLAEASLMDETVPVPDDDSRVFIEVVAWPDRDFCDGGLGIPGTPSQQGNCTACRIDISSTSKQAFCPVCGTECHLT